MNGIVVVGSCMVDLITRAERLPRLGETLTGDSFFQGFGGKGANQAVAARRLGTPVTMVARVGEDTFGEQTLANFAENGVNAEFVRRAPGTASGVAPIFVDATGQNFVLIVPGANSALLPADLEPATGMLQSAHAVICQLEIAQATVKRAFEIARRAGVMTVLNPAPAAPLLEGLLELTDLLIPNETELEALVGRSSSTLDEVLESARTLLERGPKEVIVTLGERGALYVDHGQASHHPAPRVQAFDTTGAGDAFIGALMSARVSGMPMPEAIRYANAAAAVSVTRAGTQMSFASPAEVQAHLQADHSTSW